MQICWFCLVDVAPLVVGGFQGGHGKAYLQLDRCARAVQKRSLTLDSPTALSRCWALFMYYWNPKSAQIQTVSTLNPSQLLSCFSLSIPLQGCIKEDR